MLKILIPGNHIPERTYILNTLFREFLGIEIEIETGDERYSYDIHLPNGKLIRIRDHFFSDFWKEQAYLNVAIIPDKAIHVENPLAQNQKLSLVFGSDFFEMHTENEKPVIDCGYDIFASAFFMLTRWEEFVNTKRDAHDRFPDSEAFVIKNNLHHRPLINEYTEFLWQLLLKAGYSGQRKIHSFQAYITHDVDELYKYDRISKFFRTLAGDIVHRKNPLLWFGTVKNYLAFKTGLQKDNYDTYDYLMDVSEQNGLISRFYFMPGHKGEVDVKYDIRDENIKTLIHNIQQRGHSIGIHPGYRTHNKPDFLQEELKRLEAVSNQTIEEGRQHYLRFNVPNTWNNWSASGLKKSLTLGFHDHCGFRSGVCYPFQPFDVVSRKTIPLTEIPLTIMDVSLLKESKHKADFAEKAFSLIETVKSYNGHFVLLWHNNNFNQPKWRPFKNIYEEILEKAGKD